MLLLEGLEVDAAFNAFEERCKSLKNFEFLEISRDKPIFIFGAGNFGRSIAKALKQKGFKVDGFIDSLSLEKEVDAIPVFAWSNLDEDMLGSQLLIGIYNRGASLDLLRQTVLSAGFKNIFMPWDIYRSLDAELGWRYWLSNSEIILNELEDIREIYKFLSDVESKKTLLNICLFRLGLNNAYAGFKHEDEQYFNTLTLNQLVQSNKLCYVDCGAHIGDTFIIAKSKLPLTSAYLFEPEPNNFKRLVRVARESNVFAVCMPLAVSDRHQLLAFDGAEESGAISVGGSNNIVAVALDDLMPNTFVDLIKFDVEGSEIPAIMGARQMIQRSRPVLAISLYHRPADLWKIPGLIASLCPDYQLYIRQHFYNSFDCVLYAIPQ